MTVAEQVGQRIREARLRSNLRQEDVSKSIGYSSATYICQFELGHKRIDAEIMADIARVLDVPLVWLLEPVININSYSA